MQAEGKIRAVGLAGYPLPTLLRLALLILHETGSPVDVVQTYAHQTLLCSTLEDGFLAAFATARVAQVVNAAPLSMGILTAGGGPAWHPAKSVAAVYDATREAVQLARECGSTIEAAACGFGYRTLEYNGAPVPVVVGCTNLDQIHQTLRTYAEVNGDGPADPSRVKAEKALVELFAQRGVKNVSWQSPAPDAFE
jgi:aryl-alcohol dehydrogenase-like predicted oxidoreductase